LRNVVVTGGTRGIGAAIALALVAEGYQVITVARSPPPTQLHNQLFVHCDLTEEGAAGRLAAKLRKDCGPIYGLVNNAGIGTSGILATMPDTVIAGIIAMNVIAPITLTKYLVRSMLSARQGRVVNISSIVASTGYAGLSAYSASKAALHGFTRSLAREIGPVGITVNAVAPGFVATDMTHGLTEQHRRKISHRSALQRMTTVDDIAAAVAFLMSDEAANITGTVLTVDAGNTA
jgi:3-oxoacyl-[acyl-carrier protein] reductase